VRCFEDSNVVHNMGNVDPIRDIEVITTELILADLESVEAQIERNRKKAKAQDKEAMANVALLERLVPHLNDNKPLSTLEFSDDELVRLKTFNLLSPKPVIYACNVSEEELEKAEGNPYVQQVKKYVKEQHGASCCVISAKLEADLSELSVEEAREFLKDYGVQDSGVSQLIRASYDLLGLASYFTAGEKEVRAWTFRKGMKAPQCAGVIHGDFEKGFIKAEVVSYDELVAAGSYQKARELGKYRLEGKEYVFQDGDVALFRFN
ncbi:MAG: redox-regulated ATPase YchF, partial [Verrucomicrobia bacterium]